MVSLDTLYFLIPLLVISLSVYIYKNINKNTDDDDDMIMVCEITVDGMTVYEEEVVLAWNQLISGDWGDNVKAQCIPMKKKYFRK